MIVWVASYPRSGNALLRTILHQCFGLDSYADQLLTTPPLPGSQPLPSAWPVFYERASASGMYIVKTHLPPRDDQPALYIVRDGRLAVRSYLKFQQTFQPQLNTSLLGLIVGDDYYGDWTWHHRQWAERRGPTLMLRYEELVQPQPEILHRLGEVLGSKPKVEHWHNPVDEWRPQRSQLIGSADRFWRGDVGWDEYTDAAFHLLHGPLLQQLAYIDPIESHAAIASLTRAQRDGLLAAQRTARRAAELQQVCDARQRVIDGLVSNRA